jgi:hypothetical protein
VRVCSANTLPISQKQSSSYPDVLLLTAPILSAQDLSALDMWGWNTFLPIPFDQIAASGPYFAQAFR